MFDKKKIEISEVIEEMINNFEIVQINTFDEFLSDKSIFIITDIEYEDSGEINFEE